jgi:cytidylate kinase
MMSSSPKLYVPKRRGLAPRLWQRCSRYGQKAFRRPPGLVADGRDMGTQVFADAVLKVFLVATPEERAKRRHKQLKDKGIDVSLAALSRDIENRDRRDSERPVAPLMPAEDARILDSSGRSVDAVTKTVLDWIAELGIAGQG